MLRTRITLLLLIIFASFSTAFAQKNPGFGGKHWLLKLDLVTPLSERGILGELEYVAGRNVSLTLSGLTTNALYTQRLPGYQNSNDSLAPKANLKDLQLGIGIRYYLSQAMPAPKRNYIFVSYMMGVATAQGNYFRNDNNSTNRVFDKYTATQIQSSRLNVGFGYQTFFWKRISLDFDWGVALGMLNVGDGIAVDGIKNLALIKGFSDNYGPNIVGINTISNVPGGFGLALHLKLGVLLF